MSVYIGDLISKVQVQDSTGLSPKTMAEILRVTARAMDERDEHKARVDAERRVTGGVRDEIEGEA